MSERYRGIPSLQWRPARGVNLILGGGDVGKSTIVEAIALLLSPVNPASLSDPDYHDRKIDAGFSVEAVLSLPLTSDISNQLRPSWPWEWTEAGISVTSLEDDGKIIGEPIPGPGARNRGSRACLRDRPARWHDRQFPGGAAALDWTRAPRRRRSERSRSQAGSGLSWIDCSPTKAYARAWRANSRRTRSGRNFRSRRTKRSARSTKPRGLNAVAPSSCPATLGRFPIGPTPDAFSMSRSAGLPTG